MEHIFPLYDKFYLFILHVEHLWKKEEDSHRINDYIRWETTVGNNCLFLLTYLKLWSGFIWYLTKILRELLQREYSHQIWLLFLHLCALCEFELRVLVCCKSLFVHFLHILIFKRLSWLKKGCKSLISRALF